jgi:hypothetical protein
MRVACNAQSVPKAGNGEAENEDAFAIAPETSRIAVCDGASEGWGSGAWARHLTRVLVEQPAEPQSFVEWLSTVRASAIFQAASVMSWYAEEKSAQGAFSTLLGVSFSNARDGGYKYHALAVGDTAMFHMHEEKLIARFPIERSSEFGNRPRLLGNLPESGEPEVEWFAGRAESGDRFYLVTDALGEWFLRTAEKGGDPWTSLDAVTSSANATAEFEEWVQSLRDNKQMKNDDTTMVSVRIL